MSEIKTDEVFKKLKKQNGEEVAKVIRDAVLSDVPNIVHILEFAGHNAADVRALVPVIREIYKTQNRSEYWTQKKPLELLSDAGYDAFVVKTEEQKDSIKKYYRPGEELCTFRDPTRHEDYYIIHAVKRGADKIKPADVPERQDEYGTSVISIQIAKTGGFISIKNRYNHTVNDPDNTFNSNPDKIIPGLTNSLKRFFNVEFNASENALPDNFRMVNDQFVRYNYEINNIYFGSDYYFSGSTITRLNNDYELMLDCFILDTRNGKLKNPAELKGRYGYATDTTHELLSDLFLERKIKIESNPKNKKEKIVIVDGEKIMHVVDGQMTELFLPGVTRTDHDCLTFAYGLKKLDMPDVREIADNFLLGNTVLNSLNMPKLRTTGKDFLTGNRNLTELNLPELVEMGQYSLQNNHNLVSINCPKVEYLGHLSSDQPKLKYFYAPYLDHNQLEWFVRSAVQNENYEIAFGIAKEKIHQKIDAMTDDAKQHMKFLHKKYQADNE